MRSISPYLVSILFCLFSAVPAALGDSVGISKGEGDSRQGEIMHISVRANGNTMRFALNGSPAAKALYDQLPLTIEVERYSNNEMIFYPPKKLPTAHTPLANAKAGTLAYYAPWGDVVLFYQDFGSAAGLYALGQAVSGAEHIPNLSGTIRIEKSD